MTDDPCTTCGTELETQSGINRDQIDNRLLINLRSNKSSQLGRTQGSAELPEVPSQDTPTQQTPTYSNFTSRKNSMFNSIVTGVDTNDVMKEVIVSEEQFQKQFADMYFEDIDIEIYDENGEIVNPEIYDKYADKVSDINKMRTIEFEKIREKSKALTYFLIALIVLLIILVFIYLSIQAKQYKAQENEEKRINTYRFITQGVSEADVKITEEIMNADNSLINSQNKKR